ncbi:hypothetical protein CUJ83_14770 [Methanocella sp. CWC-04]|uniref:DUF4013 domain-containing protein n=1 Tax=Methanooceanicella nereidis TaxID=2052831 RepID=A0AAP2W7C1_9EURY|nr:DUF4013 domain-containing protein [Methanocella sp. CWC-04]MCD1296263.1 hypothetical protein [Methanocella sp. CWC-04]
MVKNDDFLETVVSSIRYAFSNMGSLLIGGIVLTLSLLIIGLPFFLGYMTRCIREIIRGNGVLPDWDGIGDIFVNGIRMTIIFLIYAAIYGLLAMVPAIPVLAFQYLGIGYLAWISTAIMILTLVILSSVFGVVFFASWVIFANTGSIKVAVAPHEIVALISKNPLGYLIAIIASASMVVLGGLSMALFVTIPWAVFIICSAISYIFAKYYQNTMNRTEYNGPQTGL